MSKPQLCNDTSIVQQDFQTGVQKPPYPLSPRAYKTEYQIQFANQYKDLEIEQIMRSEALPAIASVCEMRDSAETPAPVKLQACSLILNKVLPDKIGPRLDMQVDLTRLFEMYVQLATSNNPQSSQEVKDK